MTRARPSRTLIVPAAGSGSRLGSTLPKFLAPVNGRSMLEHLLALYEPHVSQYVVVVAPAWVAVAEERLRTLTPHPGVVVAQDRPTGMLDAVLLAHSIVQTGGARRIWLTWCDQVAMHPRTLCRLADASTDDSALVLPVVTRPDPYIHFERDASGSITGVRQRREGDAMPAIGEGDAGLFSLSRSAFLDDLPAFAREATRGCATGERNLLPFIPWLAARCRVATFPCTDPMEAVGINTPDDLRAVEEYLAARDGR